jgi:hypothetical protein
MKICSFFRAETVDLEGFIGRLRGGFRGVFRDFEGDGRGGSGGTEVPKVNRSA